MIRTVAERQLITHCCPIALRAGVRPEMTLAHARALLPDQNIHIEPHDAGRDLDALRALATWALRFSPIVAPDPPDGLLIDLTGCQRLFKGERRLCQFIASSIEKLGFTVRLASAPNFACAWAVARHGPHARTLVPDGRAGDALAPLPPRALRLDDRTIFALSEIGIERIGEIMALPRAAIPARFGEELLLHLDQATGEALEVIEPIRPAPPPKIERLFEGPTRRIEAVDQAAHELLSELCRALRQRESGARQVELTLLRSDLPPESLSIRLSRPSRELKHLWSLLRPKLERAHLGFGVDGLVIRAPVLARLPHEQLERWRERSTGPTADDQRAVGELVDTLVSRLGPDNVLRAEPVESHLPERAMRHRSMLHAPERRIEHIRITPSDRPSLLYPRPEEARIIAVAPEGPPSHIEWRHTAQSIRTAIGPERLAAEWWRTREADALFSERARDYFRANLEDGRWLWLFRDLDSGRWFVHGEWA